MEDNLGLKRTVLSYLDIAKQPDSKYTLIIDEGMGRAMFAVDEVYAKEHFVKGVRKVTDVDGNDVEDVVTVFSPLLPWRIVAKSITYMVDSKTVMDREHEETKSVREIIKQYRAEIKDDTDEHVADQIEKHGDYRSGNYI